MKLLREIVKDITIEIIRGNLDIEISGIAYDSRKVENGNLFVCVKGFTTDGHKYARQAVANGAAAVIVESDIEELEGVILKTENTRLALAKTAAAFYDYPSNKLDVIGVTGTNGKTTTTYLLTDVFKQIGQKTGVIGTINNLIGDRIVPTEHTTPEASDLQGLLAEMVEEDVKTVAMEVSSHALALERVATLRYKGAIFTNLTQDHLDFHNTMDEYFASKAQLFEAYQHDKRINVINIDDSYAKKLLALTKGQTVTYGISNEQADYRARNIKLLPNGISYEVEYKDGKLQLELNLLGEFNVYNSLAVVAYTLTAGIDAKLVKNALESAKGVPGRFEIVNQGQPFTVAIDYAHTPDGLENILSSAKKFTDGSIITVFGCGGDRDKTKRPKMGAIAANLSDKVIVTSDNPRSEEPLEIIKDILAGISNESSAQIQTQVDRKKAIQQAFEIAVKGDIVIIAGKGHETYQIIKDKILHFDDCEEAEKILKGMGYEN